MDLDPPAGPNVPALPLTGERTLPGIAHENYWFQRHLAAYAFVARRCAGLRVLDAGCGEGYGTALLARTAASAMGVDREGPVVEHARAAYPGTAFVRADLGDLSLPAASVDAVVSLQVIEHLADTDAYLAEIARVLVPGGTFWCATPNRLTFTPGRDTPVNPFHVREYAPAELADVLSGRFTVRAVHGLGHGPRVRAVELLARRPFPDLVLARPPERWPRWLAAAVRAVGPGDFRLSQEGVAGCLDLLAEATRRDGREA